MTNILIPTDFSQNAWKATAYALTFFKNTICNFYILHVTDVVNYQINDTVIIADKELIDKTLLKKAKNNLQKLKTRIKLGYPNLNHNFIMISNYEYFVEAIRNHVKEKEIDLIVMGTKGASGIKEVIIGSNTGDVITKVKTPILVVPNNAVFKTLNEIAFPTDYNMFYLMKILNEISILTKMHDSYLRILYVAKKNQELTTYQEQNKEYLSDFFMDEKCSFHQVTNKRLEDGLQCFIESRNIDMLVMIAKNLTLFQQIIFKPKVERISYHTHIPFLVLHE